MALIRSSRRCFSYWVVSQLGAEMVLLHDTETHLGDYTVKRAWVEEGLTDTELLNRVIENSTLGIPPMG